MNVRNRIIVTGAGGLIGSYAMRDLHSRGFDVLGIYSERTRPAANAPWPYLILDLAKDHIPQSILSENDTVVHCAAQIPVTFADTEQIYHKNKQIDDNIIVAVQENGAHLIFISSTSVYGLSKDERNEESVVNINNLYSRGKYETEQKIGRLLSEKKKIILRINAPYAPEQRNSTVLKIFIEKALSDQPISYHGQGNREQDFTAASDVASAIAAAHVADVSANGVFNISGGAPINMRELAALIVGLIPGCKSTITSSGAADEQEAYKANFSIEKAEKFLRWKPKVRLRDGILHWVNHYKDENRDIF